MTYWLDDDFEDPEWQEPEIVPFYVSTPNTGTPNTSTATEASPDTAYKLQKTHEITCAADEYIVITRISAEFSHNWTNTAGTGQGTTHLGIKSDQMSAYDDLGSRNVARGATDSGCATLNFTNTAIDYPNGRAFGPGQTVRIHFALKYSHAPADVTVPPSSQCVRSTNVTYRKLKIAQVIE